MVAASSKPYVASLSAAFALLCMRSCCFAEMIGNEKELCRTRGECNTRSMGSLLQLKIRRKRIQKHTQVSLEVQGISSEHGRSHQELNTSGVSPSPCQQSLKLLQREPGPRLWDLPQSNIKAPFEFFLHESGAFDFSSTTRCYLDVLGARSNEGDIVDDLDTRVLPGVAQHLTDLWLLERLRSHDRRTHISDRASLHIVGAPLFTSFAASRLGAQTPAVARGIPGRMPGLHGESPCGSQYDHYVRVNRLLTALTSLHEFQRSDGSNFLLFTTHYALRGILTPPLLDLLKRGNVILATADMDYPILRDGTIRTVIIPYKATDELEASAWRHPLAKETQEVRNLSFTFHGNMQRVYGAGRYRFQLLQRFQPDFASTGSFRDVNYENYSIHDFLAVSRDTQHALLRSSFCVVPAGDTPTSRRLFDALAAGCVPIIFGRIDKVSLSLPFPATIDWPTVVLFGGRLQCAIRSDQIVEWLHGLLSANEEGLLDNMRDRGRALFRNALSYTRGMGLVDALLCELDPACTTSLHLRTGTTGEKQQIGSDNV